MTDTQTPEALFLKQATPLVRFIEDQGGPKMYEWCAIIESEVLPINMGEELCEGCETWRLPLAFNPPAVVSAVCMWVMEVADWFISKQVNYTMFRIERHSAESGYDWAIIDCEIDEFILEGSALGIKPTKELAFLALLTAICEALGYTAGDNK